MHDAALRSIPSAVLAAPLEAYDAVNGRRIVLDNSRDALLTEFGKRTLDDRYLLPGESYQRMFGRVACAYSDDDAHAQRLYDAMSRLWFMPATPVLSNGGAGRGLPISCFLNSVSDDMHGIVGTWVENVWLAANGGGIGTFWGHVRSIGEKVRAAGQTSGIIPFIGVMDRLTLAISQGDLRRGSAAVYIQVSHPEIEEFLEIRKASGDFNRKALNLHHGILISDAFMEAIRADDAFSLSSPKTGETIKTVNARELMQKILETRLATGEPYLIFEDTVNRAMAPHQRALGLKVTTSNLCSEIVEHTGPDHLGKDRTAVCCLSSVNFETYEAWKDEAGFIEDLMRFLDNVLSSFIATAPDSVADTKALIVDEFLVELVAELTGAPAEAADLAGKTRAQRDAFFSGRRGRLLARLEPDARAIVEKSLAVLARTLDAHLDRLTSEMAKARYSAMRERSVGLGYMGFHSFLQARGVPFESAMAKVWNMRLARHVKERADAASVKLALERGPCPDAAETGVMERFSHKISVAPTASISIICGGASPAIEPWNANVFTHKTLSGSHTVTNRHLAALLAARGADTAAVWESILKNEGSVEHLGPVGEAEAERFRRDYDAATEILERAGLMPGALLQNLDGAFIDAAPVKDVWEEDVQAEEDRRAMARETFAGAIARMRAALARRALEIDETWPRIVAQAGDIGPLALLTRDEAACYRTAFEIDQRWIVEFAADRTPFICQSQSVNLFLPGDIDKWDLLMIHWKAWESGCKSLYYCRSKSIQRAAFAGAGDVAADNTKEWPARPLAGEKRDYEVCLACQ